MSGSVFQQQDELGNEVFQIMNDKSGHAIEGVEFLRLQQSFICSKLRKITCGLSARRLQQIPNLPVDIDRCPWSGQYDESNHVWPIWQRNHQPSVFER